VKTQPRQAASPMNPIPTSAMSTFWAQWQEEIVSLSPFGVKVRLGATDPGPPVGTEVQLQFAPPDKKVPLSLNGVVWRVDPRRPGRGAPEARRRRILPPQEPRGRAAGGAGLADLTSGRSPAS